MPQPLALPAFLTATTPAFPLLAGLPPVLIRRSPNRPFLVAGGLLTGLFAVLATATLQSPAPARSPAALELLAVLGFWLLLVVAPLFISRNQVVRQSALTQPLWKRTLLGSFLALGWFWAIGVGLISLALADAT